MLGGMLWILAVVAMWATIFILSLFFARSVARSHDEEMALTQGDEPAHDAMATETAFTAAQAS